MEEHHINIDYTARYYTHGRLSEKTQNVWFALHGYGQLAKYFIKKFEVLKPEEHFVVAPEGMNRFYLKGFDGRIGATWMTREDREIDIENYLKFLNQVYYHLLTEKEPKYKVNILGFSQGAATASRWITDGKCKTDRLILWAGILPPDLQLDKAKDQLITKEILLVAGKKDPYIKPERLEEMQSISRNLNVEPKEIWYDGEHQIVPEVLQRIATTFY